MIASGNHTLISLAGRSPDGVWRGPGTIFGALPIYEPGPLHHPSRLRRSTFLQQEEDILPSVTSLVYLSFRE